MKHFLHILIVLIFTLFPFFSAVAAGNAIIRISSVETHGNCTKLLYVVPETSTPINTGCAVSTTLILSDADIGTSSACNSMEEINQVDYPLTQKLLIAAFLGNKRVKATWGDCLPGGYAAITKLRVVFD